MAVSQLDLNDFEEIVTVPAVLSVESFAESFRMLAGRAEVLLRQLRGSMVGSQ